MSTTHRYIRPATASGLVPADGQPAMTRPGGPSYSCAIGSYVDAPTGLYNANLMIDLGEVGGTHARPECRKDADVGRRYIDTDLGGVSIVWDGAAWRLLSGAAA